MTPLEIAVVLMIATVAGMLVALSVDAVLLGAYVKAPGRECARYWASGSTLVLAGSIIFLRMEGDASLWRSALVVGIFLLGHVLHWRGLQIFFFKPRDPIAWPAAALFMLAYLAMLFQGADFATRRAFISLVPMVVWPACMLALLKADYGRRSPATRLALAGLALMMVAALFDLAFTMLPEVRELLARRAFLSAVLDTAMPIFGGILYLASLVLLYFDRVAEHTNYAATHDELTGLLNRRAIIAAGKRELEFARRSQLQMVLAFLDIDHFKHINDQYGHDTGDLVLREVSKVLQEHCRSIDLVGRYGGEEFCIVLPGDHQGGANMIGTRLVQAVAAHEIEGFPERVTVSVGLVPLGSVDGTLDWEGLVQLSDLELYRAKQGGRNTYRVYREEPRSIIQTGAADATAPRPGSLGSAHQFARP